MNNQEIRDLAIKLGLPSNASLGDIRTAFNKQVEQAIELEKNPPVPTVTQFMNDFWDQYKTLSVVDIDEIEQIADIFLYYLLCDDKIHSKALKLKEEEFKEDQENILNNLKILKGFCEVLLNSESNPVEKLDSIYNFCLNDLKNIFPRL